MLVPQMVHLGIDAGLSGGRDVGTFSPAAALGAPAVPLVCLGDVEANVTELHKFHSPFWQHKAHCNADAAMASGVWPS